MFGARQSAKHKRLHSNDTPGKSFLLLLLVSINNRRLITYYSYPGRPDYLAVVEQALGSIMWLEEVALLFCTVTATVSTPTISSLVNKQQSSFSGREMIQADSVPVFSAIIFIVP